MDINGKKLVNIPHAVSNLITNDERQDQAISELEERVRQALVGVFHYKGSVATYADLPVTDNQVGDVYNVLETGANYAWAGTEWDDLSGIVDLSNYVTLDSNQTITGIKTFGTKIQFGNSNNSIGENSNELELKSGSQIRVYNNIRPSTGGTYSLGNSSLPFKEAYLSDAVYVGNTWSIDNHAGELSFVRFGDLKYLMGTFSFFPNYNNQNDLGKDGQRWKDFYLAGEIDLQAQKRVKFTLPNSNVYAIGSNQYNYLQIDYNGVGMYSIATSAIFPNSNNSRDLGTNSLTWRDLFLGRNLTDGTNSVTVAELKALIDYAKAQGWIS